MQLKILEIAPERLVEYDRIPSRLEVKERLEIVLVEDGLSGMLLHIVPVEKAYIKDNDSYGEIPSDWPKKFDVSTWGFFLAMAGNNPAGGASVAYHSDEVTMLESRRDMAVLWDLRVDPAYRGAGILLFRFAAEWARKHDCTQMKTETQNVNVPACRFYRRMGCRLGEIRRFGYAAIPAVKEEVMLNWYLDLQD